MRSLHSVARAVIHCAACPRLIAHCRAVARERKREFRDWAYWGKPVPGFGDPDARLLIVGLAPAAHGANRTGRMFTGDSSGDWLSQALHRFGFANQPISASRHDGLTLTDCYITAAARCAPPGNQPTAAELARCRPYLASELRLLTRIRVVGTTRAGGAAGVRPRRRVPAARWNPPGGVVSPEPTEHQHRTPDSADVGPGVREGEGAAGVGAARWDDRRHGRPRASGVALLLSQRRVRGH
jgi:uracil-DNA glycosylase family 4